MVLREDLELLSKGADQAANQFAGTLEGNRDRALRQLLQSQSAQAEKARQMEALGHSSNENLLKRDMEVSENEKDRALKRELANRQLAALLGKSHKPTSEEQKRNLLAQEGLETSERLQQAIEQNPKANRAVIASEGLRSIPVVGNVLGDTVSGIANLLNPAAKNIEADREKLARNMLYLKSGASAAESEVAGTKRQLPGITTKTEEAKKLYSTFAKPFKEAQALPGRMSVSQSLSDDEASELEQLRRELGQ